MTDASELIKQRNEARALVRSGKTKLKLLKTGGIKAHPDYVFAFERSVQKAVRSLAKIEQLVLANEHGEGCVAATRSRETGTLAQLYAPGTQDSEPADNSHGDETPGWFVVCADHGTCVTTTTRKHGEWAMRHPTEFCDDCRAIVNGAET